MFGVEAAYAEIRFATGGRKTVLVTSGGKRQQYVTKDKALTVGVTGLGSPGVLKVKTTGGKIKRITTIK